MATYTQLKVFKETYDLLTLIYQNGASVGREYKYTLLEKIKNDVTELCIIIYRANLASDKKVKQIEEAIELLVRINIQCRMLADLKQISTKLSALIIAHTQSIHTQLDSWRKYSKEKEQKVS